jgi:co-chaperonin GroES (HSP10)
MDDFYNDFLYSSYKTYTAQQHPSAWKVFDKFLNDEKFDIILEIGTAQGGFTEFIYDLDYNIISYDVKDSFNTYEKLIEKGINIKKKNIFNSDYSKIIDTEFLDYLNQGKVLVLCDGANKSKELDLISTHIKVGDIIMAHDYCIDEKTFETKYKDKEWRYLEIVESDINVLDILSPYKQEMFNDIFWVCKTKVKPYERRVI